MRIAILLLFLLPAWALDVKSLNLDRLAAKATENVEVTLDSSLLQFAGRFLSGKDADEAQAKKLISGLKGIYVRSFEFSKENEYSPADVEAVRAQLKAPDWARVVEVKSKLHGENAEIYFNRSGDKVGGLAVLCAQPKEFTFVFIDGAIDPEQISELAGHFGVPKIEMEKKAKKGATK